MTARHPTQSDLLRQSPNAEAYVATAPADWVGPAGTPFTSLAVLMLAALTLALLLAPAVIAMATLADPHSLDPLPNWLEAAARLVQPFDYFRAGVTVTAAGLVLVRREES